MADLTSDPALGLSFTVKIDGKDLGAFHSCEGLGVEVVIDQREEGGNSFFVHQLAGRLKYTNIKFSRYINGDTKKVADWFASMANGVKRSTAEIVAMTPDERKIASWGLRDVLPVRWTGPSFSAGATSAASETLEICHQGFHEPGSPT